MNSSLACISILVKSNIGKKCLINSLMNMSNEALMEYLELANVYKSNSSKKKDRSCRDDCLWTYE